MSVSFHLTTHRYERKEIVEIWVHGHMVGTIYPNDRNGIRLMTNHFGHMTNVDSSGTRVLNIEFDVSNERKGGEPPKT